MELVDNNIRYKERSVLFDNIKALLIILVVFGHMINIVFRFQGNESNAVFILWRFIYLFHMPCFVFVSGYFSKKFSAEGIIRNIIIPYFVFNSLFYVMHKNLTFPLFPDSAMWYLFALAIWKMLIPYFVKVRFAIPISVFIAFVYDFISINDQDNGVAKVIIFFPFFLLGYYFTEKQMQIINTKYKKVFIVVALFLIIIFFLIQAAGFKYTDEMLYAKTSRITFDQHGMIIYIIRKISGLLGLAITALIICTIPDKKFHITTLGQHTLTIYLLALSQQMVDF